MCLNCHFTFFKLSFLICLMFCQFASLPVCHLDLLNSLQLLSIFLFKYLNRARVAQSGIRNVELDVSNKDTDKKWCIQIIHCSFSGHDIKIMKLNVCDITRGPGTWMMNLHTIRSDCFRHVFTNWWVYWKLENKSFFQIWGIGGT
jgi:hypothetical protein